jgi:PHD/YefM family antitoxin component YafN of YafNO toxin-antitoxin module
MDSRMNLNRDIHSLTEFKLHTPDFVQQLKETGEPLVLTINGKAELVVQDAASYQKLLDLAEEAKVLEGIRQGLENMKAGRTIGLDDFKEHARKKHGISI